ncbi:tetratricopeptide repeat protein [Geobacter sp. AOG1]|uniref:tetratricopeptide repeat protein n=1 Tax=Geobacter sp. AOG1 TaxID=1566346 RepID=UPI001CC74823|nr:outer membrane protein assembly factor BamD [Geobacter sp. AOG1]
MLVTSLFANPVFALDSEDSQIFITGFNAYQKRDYQGAIDKMSLVLQKYPDTPLRDMAIFWLARANYKAGNEKDAARYMAQFLREYPDSPLKGTVEDTLLQSAARYEKGEPVLAAGQDKAAAEKLVAEKAEAERQAAKKTELERLTAQKAEADRLAAEQAATAQAAAAKLAADQVAAKAAQQKAAADRLIAEQAAAQKLAAEKAEAERQAARLAAQKAESDRLAAEQAAAAQAAAAKLAADQVVAKAAQEKAEADRLIAEQAAAEKLAAEKAEAERQVARKTELERLAAQKAEADRLAAEQVTAAQASAEKVALTVPPAPVSPIATTPAVVPAPHSDAMREKAIAEYKNVIDRYPGTTAAVSAATKLKTFGIVYPPVSAVASPAVRPGEKAQILTLEVDQSSAMTFNLLPMEQSSVVGKRVIIPFEVSNRGNGVDNFAFESGFPAEFKAQFASAAEMNVPLGSTPQLAPGESFRGVVGITIPQGAIDGQKISYPIRLNSQATPEVSQTRQVSLVASAPLLRAVIKGDKGLVLPGEKVTYRIALLNIGTSAAASVTMRLNYPPQYEPVDFAGAGFRKDVNGVLEHDPLRINSGESKEFNLVFKLKDEAIARQELFLRCDTVNNELDTRDSFISTAALVQGVSGVAVRTTAGKVAAIPGQTVTIPLVVTNTGNLTENIEVKLDLPANLRGTLFHDLNRDGIRQVNEPAITRTPSLSPKEEAYLLLEVATPSTVNDGSEARLGLVFVPESERSKQAVLNALVVFTRPVVEMVMSGKGGKLKPGDVSSFELTGVNRGSLLARVVEMRSSMPANLELVTSEPPVSGGQDGNYLWRFAELGAGEKKVVKVTFKVKQGIAVGTSIQVKNTITYEDPLGNGY